MCLYKSDSLETARGSRRAQWWSGYCTRFSTVQVQSLDSNPRPSTLLFRIRMKKGHRNERERLWLSSDLPTMLLENFNVRLEKLHGPSMLPDKAKFLVCSIISLALSFWIKHLVIGQLQKPA